MGDLLTILNSLDGPILIVGNKSPDADSISSALALVSHFRSVGVEATYYIVESPKENSWMLDGISSLWITYEPIANFSTLIIVDDAFDVERLGIKSLNLRNKKVLIIDHHLSNCATEPSNGVILHWRDAPSTASILADEGLTFPLLYVGMHADTLGFSVRSRESLRSVGVWLNSLPSTVLSSEQVAQYNSQLSPQFSSKFLEAFLDGESMFISGLYKGREYQTVHLAVDLGIDSYYPLLKVLSPFADLYSLTDLTTGRTSVRSNNDDLNALMFCQIFGGGGHLRASGCNVTTGGAKPLAGFRNFCAQVERKLVSPRVRAFM